MRTTLNNIGTKKPTDPGMYGVQTWSAGPIYPAVIAVIEEYETPGYHFRTVGKRVVEDVVPAPLLSRAYELTIPGQPARQFDSREAAEEHARLAIRGVTA